MEKRNNYYVSRKNALTWLSALLMLCSAVARIVLFCEEGADSSTEMWLQIILPALASIWFVLIILLDGKRHFFRTALPVWIMALGFASMARGVFPYRTLYNFWMVLGQWALCFSVAAFYTRVSNGKVKHFWLLWFFSAALTAFFVFQKRELISLNASLRELMQLSQYTLLAASIFVISLAIQVYPDGAGYFPTWGDRSYGRRVRTLPAINYVTPYIMPSRNTANNELTDAVEITEMEQYVRRKRREGLTNFGPTHVFLAAYIRTVAQYPAINRFLAGQKIYSRDGDIVFNMVIKTEMTTDAPDTAIKLHFRPDETANQVYEKFNQAVLDVKGGPLDSDFDATAKLLTLVPGVVLKFVIWLLKLLDYFGLLPGFLVGVSPFHGSIFFTSMGSLGIPPVVHHLYDFGDLPVFVAFGCKRREQEVGPGGVLVTRKYIDYTVNTDERICDGFYFAAALKYMRKYLQHPDRLDSPPDMVVQDIP